MTVDLLTARLKAAKRELTALKTSHMRGLGLAKVYSYSGVFSPPSYNPYLFTMTINFDREFAKNPLTYISLGGNDLSDPWIGSSAEIDNESFTSDGYSMVVDGYVDETQYTTSNFVVYSVSPILGISWEWTLDE
jgi:hypothetical protein